MGFRWASHSSEQILISGGPDRVYQTNITGKHHKELNLHCLCISSAFEGMCYVQSSDFLGHLPSFEVLCCIII